MANGDRMVNRERNGHNGERMETTIAPANGTIADNLRPPLPLKWGPKCNPRDMSNFEWPHLRPTACLVL